MILARGLSIEIEVDGGVNPTNCKTLIQAGADILVAGSAIYGPADYTHAIRVLRAGSFKDDCQS